MSATLEQADVVAWAESYSGQPFHALLCDPPYGLSFMGKEWDSPWKCSTTKPGIGARETEWPAHGSTRNPICRGCGKRRRGKVSCECPEPIYDETAASNNQKLEEWYRTIFAALARHLHPGAFIMAFASSRGWHRQAVAMEDAGLVMHPTIWGWVYGSGFPKASRVADAPDFDGHRYGLQALKPAVEPILVFQKPYAGKPRECIVRTGAGALNIDGGRIGTSKDVPGSCSRGGQFASGGWKASEDPELPGAGARSGMDPTVGRWPSNLVLYHHPECELVGERQAKSSGRWPGARPAGSQISGPSGHVGQDGLEEKRAAGETVEVWRCAPGCAVAAMDRQSGDVGQAGDLTGEEPSSSTGIFGKFSRRNAAVARDDSGGASRFFFRVQEKLDAADPIRYQAKASRSERDVGLEGREAAPGAAFPMRAADGERGGEGLDGTKTDRKTVARNRHPTVKPIELARYLATLLLPPAAYAPRRILVSFAGVGSEMIGAALAGWEEVLGVEREAEYVEIGRERIAYHLARKPADQGDLFAADPAPLDFPAAAEGR